MTLFPTHLTLVPLVKNYQDIKPILEDFRTQMNAAIARHISFLKYKNDAISHFAVFPTLLSINRTSIS